MYSGAGAAMLKSLFHSYNVQEAVWAVLIGSAIWSPVIIFYDYIIVQPRQRGVLKTATWCLMNATFCRVCFRGR